MIKSITFKSGPKINDHDFEIQISPITIFIGPNNSGKSKILSEIAYYCQSAAKDDNFKIIQDVNFLEFAEEELYVMIQKGYNGIVCVREQNGDYIEKKGVFRYPKDDFRQSLLFPNNHRQQYCQIINKIYHLTGLNRLTLINKERQAEKFNEPKSPLQKIVYDSKNRELLRELLYSAFNKYFVIDITHAGQLEIKYSDKKPISDSQELGLSTESFTYHKGNQSIDEFSDGVKAYTGILLGLMTSESNIILLDEPEAFLHPSLVFSLGKQISSYIVDKTKNVFISTHNANFIMGCLQTGIPITIIRLTYQNAIASTQAMDYSDLVKFMRNPLLRSVGVINALFYNFVIVTEGDTDRAFYNEINERLLTFSENRGIPNCLFLNAQNKQTIPTIVQLLRKMGVPTAAIMDLDAIKKDSDWSFITDAFSIPELCKSSIYSLRTSVEKKLNDINSNYKIEGGVQNLSVEDKKAAEDLFRLLSSYGLFIVPNGEIESWLKNLSVDINRRSNHGTKWIINIFEKMGDDPNSDYVFPTDGDVWNFVSSIGDYFFEKTK